VPTLVDTFRNTQFQGEAKQDWYDLPGGGKIWFCSADRPESLEGGQYKAAWIDEGGQISDKAWVAIQARLGRHQGRCLITTTPYTRNWLYSDFYQRYLQNDKTYDCIQFSSIENPVYPQEEMERMRKTLPDWQFQMRYQGMFTQPEGLVYPEYEQCFVSHFNPPSGEKVGGIDFGFRDPFVALSAIKYIKNDKVMLYVYGERYKTNTTIDEHARHLPPDHMWFCDPSRPDSIEELCRLDRTARKTLTNEIMNGIQKVHSLMAKKRLLISDKCTSLKAELSQYEYQHESTGENKVSGLDHACDALRYLVCGLRMD
jgi:PBSX family phage terminase large subunit